LNITLLRLMFGPGKSDGGIVMKAPGIRNHGSKATRNGRKKMADQYRKLQAEKWRQISLHKAASEKLETLCSNFKYGKKLKRGKTIEAMAWQYNVIKDTNKSIVFRNGKYEVIENG